MFHTAGPSQYSSSQSIKSETSSPYFLFYSILYITILFVGIFLRFYQLDLKPFHHDEAIFSMYSVFQYDHPDINFYHYLPMLNGPILFYIQELFFKIWGVGDVIARLPLALLSALLMLIPLVFRKKLGWRGLLLATLLVATSPLMIYFCRFVRHEYLVLWLYCWFLWAIFQSKLKLTFFQLPIILAIHWCVKENIFVFLAINVGFVFFECFYKLINRKKGATLFPSLNIKKILPNLMPYLWWLLGGVLIGSIIFCLFYSAFGRFPQGITDGLFEGIKYWSEQHQIERIKGPFSIHLLVLTWYELGGLFFILFMLFFDAFKRFPIQYWKILSAIFILAYGMSYFFHPFILGLPFVQQVLKLKNPLDVGFFIFIIPFSILEVWYLRAYASKALAFIGYLFVAHFFTYSFLGEKVPWLALYPLFFGLIFAVMLFKEQKPFRGILFWGGFFLLALYNISYAYRVSFIHHSSKEEFIIQVHPVENYKKTLIDFAQNLIENKSRPQPRMLLLDDSSWINFWYLHRLPLELAFDANQVPMKEFDGVVSTKSLVSSLGSTHKEIMVSYAGWWVIDERQLSFERILNYAFTHEPWNPCGDMKIFFYQKKTP